MIDCGIVLDTRKFQSLVPCPFLGGTSARCRWGYTQARSRWGYYRWSTPPPPSRDMVPPQIGQQMEYLIRDGRYASCVHAGGFSSYWGVFTLTKTETDKKCMEGFKMHQDTNAILFAVAIFSVSVSVLGNTPLLASNPDQKLLYFICRRRMKRNNRRN